MIARILLALAWRRFHRANKAYHDYQSMPASGLWNVRVAFALAQARDRASAHLDYRINGRRNR